MSNPFNKLKVHRDEEEDHTTSSTQKVQKKEEPVKKTKQRPPEQKEVKEEHDDHGFEEVGKTQTKKQRYNNDDSNVDTSKPSAKTENPRHHKKYEGAVRVGSNQRAFDRHSGTGRGKEVKKEGAGGKGTWGNQEKSAPREIYDNYDNSDYYFNKVLNPKKTKEEDVIVEEPVKEEVKVEEPVKEEVAFDDAKDKKGKKKPIINPEEDEKNKLVIPENAISYSEWKEQNKRTAPVAKEVKVEVNLEKVVRNNQDEVIGIQGKQKAQPKKKEKPVEKSVAVEVKYDDGQREKKNYNQKGGNKGFKFTKDEFPELK